MTAEGEDSTCHGPAVGPSVEVMPFVDTDPEFTRNHADFVDETLRNASLGAPGA